MSKPSCSINSLSVKSSVRTGEEDEQTLQQTRAKLYTMDSKDTYKERGIGTLKVNVRKSDGLGARISKSPRHSYLRISDVACSLVMRAEGVFRLILNANLFAGMPCAIGQDPKFIKLSVVENGAFVHHAIKVRLAAPVPPRYFMPTAPARLATPRSLRNSLTPYTLTYRSLRSHQRSPKQNPKRKRSRRSDTLAVPPTNFKCY